MTQITLPDLSPTPEQLATEALIQDRKEAMVHRHRAFETATRVAGVIGLAGPQGAGKDTMAQVLRYFFERHGQPCSIDSFARPLYEMIAALTGLPIQLLQDRRYKDAPINWPGAPRGMGAWTPRKLLRWMGTEVVRNTLGSTWWVDRMHERAAAVNHVLIISDVRYDNEAVLCDYVLEVMRHGVDYSTEHSSAKRIDQRLISATVWAEPQLDYHLVGARAAMTLQARTHVADQATTRS